MAIKITNECINCGACEPECPNKAIYEGSENWSFADGTNIKNNHINYHGKIINKNELQPAKNSEIYFIVHDKCTECVDFYEEPQCASVCPVNCCIYDDNYIETKDQLLKKKNFLHNNN